MYIGQASKLTGATPKAIRLYERMGLIPTPQRKGRYRVYTDGDVQLIEVVKKAQRLGFRLSEMKGLFDRILLPGAAFTFDPGKIFPRKLLAGRTARLIVTANAPVWYHRLVSGDPVVKVVKGLILEFCGVAVTSVSRFGPIKGSAGSVRAKWLRAVHVAGARDVTRSGAKRRRARYRAA